MNEKTLLNIQQLHLGFPTEKGYRPVVHGVDLEVCPGEIVGVLGESGSGKTVSLKAVFGVADEEFVIASGQVYFEGQNLLALNSKERQKLRGKALAYIPQNASDALTPHQPVGKQLQEIAAIHKVSLSHDQLILKLKAVGIDKPEAILSMYPHQLSGGLAQRIVIAMSTILTPKLTVADEPTSAIDASLKGTVLSLLKSINQQDGTAMVIITHDFEVIKEICDRVYVMYKGLIMESAPAEALLQSPRHPYTQGLIRCVESLSDTSPAFYAMKEPSPDLRLADSGERCPFAPRCPMVMEKCFDALPAPTVINGRMSRCHLEEANL